MLSLCTEEAGTISAWGAVITVCVCWLQQAPLREAPRVLPSILYEQSIEAGVKVMGARQLQVGRDPQGPLSQ